MRSHVEALLCASNTRAGTRGHAWTTQSVSLVNHGLGEGSRKPLWAVL